MKRIVIVLFVLLTLGLFASQASLTAAGPGGDCNAFGIGSIPDLTSLAISFTCAAEATVYFGACDSGSVPNDDLFEITYEGQAVSFNLYSGGSELVNIGSALVPAGSHTASLNSLSTTPFPPATYTYAISSDKAAVESTLFDPNTCGADISSGPITSTCSFGPRNVPVFTQDAAPTNGTLEFRIMLGNEDSRQVSGLMMEWDIVAGQQLNNVMVPDLPAPRYARLWWQPADSADWYMLTSQYWHGDGTTDSEYGIECAMGAQPSYHTSFASAVPESAVCFDLLNGCH
jgi:hypothetical protein